MYSKRFYCSKVIYVYYSYIYQFKKAALFHTKISLIVYGNEHRKKSVNLYDDFEKNVLLCVLISNAIPDIAVSNLLRCLLTSTEFIDFSTMFF